MTGLRRTADLIHAHHWERERLVLPVPVRQFVGQQRSAVANRFMLVTHSAKAALLFTYDSTRCAVAGDPCLTSRATLHSHYASHGQPARAQARVHKVFSEMLNEAIVDGCIGCGNETHCWTDDMMSLFEGPGNPIYGPIKAQTRLCTLSHPAYAPLPFRGTA